MPWRLGPSATRVSSGVDAVRVYSQLRECGPVTPASAENADWDPDIWTYVSVSDTLMKSPGFTTLGIHVVLYLHLIVIMYGKVSPPSNVSVQCTRL